MVASTKQQLRLLLWKTTIEKRRSWSAIAPSVIPLSMCFLLIVIYEAIVPGYKGKIEQQFMPVALVIVIPTITTTVVAEKSTRLLESMKMMGLSEVAYFLNLLLVEGVLYGFFIGFLIACFAKIPNAWAKDSDGNTAGLFDNANFGLVLITFWVYSIAAVPFGVFLSAFFDRPKLAAQVSKSVCFAVVIFQISYDMANVGKGAVLALSTMPPYGLARVLNTILPDCDDCRDVVGFGELVATMLGSSLGFAILAWYFREVVPSEFGIRKPFYFPLLPGYWGLGCAYAKRNSDATGVKGSGQGMGTEALLVNEDESESKKESCVEVESTKIPVCDDDGDCADVLVPRGVDPQNFEAVPSKMLAKESVRVRGLRKTFFGRGGKNVAVKDLAFEMYEDSLFALLGHNGAGKTTTINMLTGLFAPDRNSGGDTTIYGHSIANDMDGVRRVLGVCPQHDVLIPNLTSYEHVVFFAMLKGSSYEDANAEAEKLLADFRLSARRDHFGGQLSGGVRSRRRSISSFGRSFVRLSSRFLFLSYACLSRAHTHAHTHIYIYILYTTTALTPSDRHAHIKKSFREVR